MLICEFLILTLKFLLLFQSSNSYECIFYVYIWVSNDVHIQVSNDVHIQVSHAVA
jgi:hypothetical protein